MQEIRDATLETSDGRTIPLTFADPELDITLPELEEVPAEDAAP